MYARDVFGRGSNYGPMASVAFPKEGMFRGLMEPKILNLTVVFLAPLLDICSQLLFVSIEAKARPLNVQHYCS